MTHLHIPHAAVLHDISQLLNTQLDKETLATCVGMIESGVNPEALAVSDFLSAWHSSADGHTAGCHS